MYSAAFGVMCVSRFERSDKKDDDDEGTAAPGTMVSFWIVAMRPR